VTRAEDLKPGSQVQRHVVLEERCKRRPLRVKLMIYRVFQKTDTQFYFWDKFGNSAPILTILSLLQAEIYGA